MSDQITVPFTNLREKFPQLSTPTETPTQYVQRQIGFSDSDILGRRLYEDDHDYETRIKLNNIFREKYGTQMDGPTIDMIVSSMIDKAKYGVVYQFQTENTINIIEKSIKK